MSDRTPQCRTAPTTQETLLLHAMRHPRPRSFHATPPPLPSFPRTCKDARAHGGTGPCRQPMPEWRMLGHPSHLLPVNLEIMIIGTDPRGPVSSSAAQRDRGGAL
jgi:hypothetical protein